MPIATQLTACLVPPSMVQPQSADHGGRRNNVSRHVGGFFMGASLDNSTDQGVVLELALLT
jgi:hypothetical protein